nr:hypothetical protein CFP56_78536 [Quercus suber]
MSLNPLLSLPFKSLANPSNISSPQNCGCPLYSLFSFTTSQLHQLFFFSFQPSNPLARKAGKDNSFHPKCIKAGKAKNLHNHSWKSSLKI